MRIAQVSGTSGTGQVVEIHSANSVQAIEEFLSLRGVGDRAIVAPSTAVQVGTIYDGTDFVQPATPTQPTPQPKTVEQLTAELDAIRERKISAYVARWGDLSKRELWPQLYAEMVRAVDETSRTLDPAKYPALSGFLVGSGTATPTGGQIYAYAAQLRGHKSAHVAFLRRGEVIREQLVTAYAALTTDAEKLDWDAEAEWAEREAE